MPTEDLGAQRRASMDLGCLIVDAALGSRANASDDRVLVADVVRPHGVRGEVVVVPHSDVRDRFRPGATLSTLDGSRVLVVETSRAHKKSLLIRFEGIGDRDQAETLRGLSLFVERSSSPPIEDPDTYYQYELLGCVVEDSEFGELGTVVDVVEDGGGILLEVDCSGERAGLRLSVPFVKAFLLQVDVQTRSIRVRLPEGLIETCVSTS